MEPTALNSSPDVRILWLMRFVGAMAFGLVLLAWGSKSITDPHARRAFRLSACGGGGAAFVVRHRLLMPLFNANELVIVQLDN